MRLKLIACDVMHRELCAAVARSPHHIDPEFLPKNLHDAGPDALRQRLQQSIDAVDPASCESILLGYAMCGAGTVGLCARSLPLIVPRAYDCITLLMGGCDRLHEYSSKNPGVSFRSTGWLEPDQDVETIGDLKIQSGARCSLEELVERYGEDGGQYLYQQFNSHQNTYRQLTFIETGLERSDAGEKKVRNEAAGRGLEFEKVPADLGMLDRLLAGDWNSKEFLVVPPGHRIVAVRGKDLLGTEPCEN